jgi:hypothetical protein
MKNKKTTSDRNRTILITNSINLGFKDYIGARVLINNELNLQAAILASTSIEKYFKALIAFNGNICKGHLKDSLLNAVKNFDPKLFSALNYSFLIFLKEVYQLRYYDNNIKPGFSLQVCNKKFLAELDYSVFEIQKRITLNKNGRMLETKYDTFIKNNNQLILNNNYIHLGIEKPKFIEQENTVYGVLFDENMNMIEANYKTMDVKDDGYFMGPGLIQKK